MQEKSYQKNEKTSNSTFSRFNVEHNLENSQKALLSLDSIVDKVIAAFNNNVKAVFEDEEQNASSESTVQRLSDAIKDGTNKLKKINDFINLFILSHEQNDLKKNNKKENQQEKTKENPNWFDESEEDKFEIIDENKAITCYEFLKHISNTKIKIQTFFRALAKADFSWWSKIFERPNKIKISLATIWKAKIVSPLKEWKEKAAQSIKAKISDCDKAWGQYHNHEGLLILKELGLKLSPSQNNTLNKCNFAA